MPLGASRAGLMSVAGDDIPDSGLWLDDFANDPTLSNTQITDRKSFSDLSYQFDDPDKSEFDGPETRFDWEVNEGNPSDDWEVIDGQLISTTSDLSENQNFYSPLPETVSGDSNVNLFVEIEDGANTETDGAYNLASTNSASFSVSLQDGYSIYIPSAGDIEIIDVGSSFNQIMFGSYPTDDDPHTIRLKINLDTNDLELFVDGEIEDTVNDSSHTSFDFVGLGVNDGGSWGLSTNRIEVF